MAETLFAAARWSCFGETRFCNIPFQQISLSSISLIAAAA